MRVFCTGACQLTPWLTGDEERVSEVSDVLVLETEAAGQVGVAGLRTGVTVVRLEHLHHALLAVLVDGGAHAAVPLRRFLVLVLRAVATHKHAIHT